MAVPSKCSMRARIIFSIIGVIVGISVFVCFSVGFRNWSTAICGFASGIVAGATLVLHTWYLKNTSEEYKQLAHCMKPIMITGCFVQLAGVCGFIAFLTVAIFEHQALTPYGRGYYLTTIWCFMTWKWGFLLFLYARSYRGSFRSLYRHGHTGPRYATFPEENAPA